MGRGQQNTDGAMKGAVGVTRGERQAPDRNTGTQENLTLPDICSGFEFVDSQDSRWTRVLHRESFLKERDIPPLLTTYSL